MQILIIKVWDSSSMFTYVLTWDVIHPYIPRTLLVKEPHFTCQVFVPVLTISSTYPHSPTVPVWNHRKHETHTKNTLQFET